MRDLSGLGRSGLPEAEKASSREACASPRRYLTDATSIGKAPARRPRPPSSRPETGVLVELLIYGGNGASTCLNAPDFVNPTTTAVRLAVLAGKPRIVDPVYVAFLTDCR